MSRLSPADVCVVIPAYNEENNIQRVVRGVLSHGYKVLAVDDGSKDSTAAKIRELGVPAVFAEVNGGKGASLQKGLEWARKSDFKAVILMDADGQHAPEEIERFVRALEAGADLVIGSRMACTTGMSPLRLVTNRVMSWMISAKAGQRVEDSQCGFRGLSRRAVDGIRLGAQRFETESEMIFRASDAKLKIASVPISCIYGEEVSKIRPVRDTLRFFKFLFSYR